MNNNKKPEKTEFKNNTKDIGKIVTIVFFTLAVLILLVTLLLVYTPLKDILFKNPITEETGGNVVNNNTEETSGIEKDDGAKEITKEEKVIEKEVSEEEAVKISVAFTEEMKHQGDVLDIDYENKIISIKNERNGEIEKLDKFFKFIDDQIDYVNIWGNREKAKFEDIKVGYYLVAFTAGEIGGSPELIELLNSETIEVILFSERRWFELKG